VALAVVQDLGLTDPPPMAGLAKGREEGEADKVWLPGRKNPVDFRADSPGLLLLMKIRDESHRYVQSFHHRTRKKGSIRSVLMDIPGLGPGRRKAMLKQFGSVQAIGEAALEDLQAVKGMNRTAALAVHAFFHPAAEPPGDRQDLSLPEV
jgi:excinuclease ABC subunit C